VSAVLQVSCSLIELEHVTPYYGTIPPVPCKSVIYPLIAISTAAILQIYISTTFRFEPIGSPGDVTAAFQMLRRSPNLEKGRKTTFKMNLKGELL
jgi:hypothetical protein